MNNAKIISIIALIILFIGLIGSVLTFTKARDKTDWEEKEVTINPKEVKNIKIDNNNAEVEILPTNDEEIVVEYSARDINEQLSTELNDSTLSIQVKDKSKKWFNFGFFSFTKSLKVFVPEKDYDQLVVTNDNGRIHLNHFIAEEVDLHSDNGRITIDHVEVSSLYAKSNNGRIEVNSVLADQIEVRTSNGKVTLENVEGDIVARSNNGRLSLKTKDLNRSLDFETDNGKIAIQTEQEPTDAVLDLRVDNGSIKVFGQSNWDTIIGNGNHLIKLVTKNGGINITK